MQDSSGRSLTLTASEDNYARFISFIESQLNDMHLDPVEEAKVVTACDEVITNVINFAYPGQEGILSVTVEKGPGSVSATFVDEGIAFNPLEKPDVDVSLSFDRRTPGGLGILLVKRLMDEVEYRHSDGKNILRIARHLSRRPQAVRGAGS